MATIYNIDEKLTNDTKEVVFSGVTYKANDGIETVAKAMALMDDPTLTQIDGMKKVIGLILGDEALNAILDRNLTMTNFQKVFITIMALISEETYEVTEERFQKSK